MYLSCHGCMLIDDGICDGLDSCVALDLGHNNISDDGLQTLLDKVSMPPSACLQPRQQCKSSADNGPAHSPT